jgi:hypothetical protein
LDTAAIRVGTKAPALRTAVLDNTAMKNDMVKELASFILLLSIKKIDLKVSGADIDPQRQCFPATEDLMKPQPQESKVRAELTNERAIKESSFN